jgi:Protein of unknown function (DUF4230)
MFKKAIVVILPVAAGFVLCLLVTLSHLPGTGSTRTINSSSLLQKVQALSQLVTVKYVIQQVVDVHDTKIYGENHLTLMAEGVVNAGINLENMRAEDIKVSDKKITITLPHPVITALYLDEKQTKVMEWTTGLFRAFDKDLEQTTRAQAVDQIRTQALDMGILKDAQDRAQTQIENLLHQMGFAEVQVHKR